LNDDHGTPIADIAHAVGYTNISHFNKLFKEEYGCTPGMFRSHATQPAAPPEPAPARPSNPPADAG
jgi:AraC-like DNA-binding protein